MRKIKTVMGMLLLAVLLVMPVTRADAEEKSSDTYVEVSTDWQMAGENRFRLSDEKLYMNETVLGEGVAEAYCDGARILYKEISFKKDVLYCKLIRYDLGTGEKKTLYTEKNNQYMISYIYSDTAYLICHTDSCTFVTVNINSGEKKVWFKNNTYMVEKRVGDYFILSTAKQFGSVKKKLYTCNLRTGNVKLLSSKAERGNVIGERLYYLDAKSKKNISSVVIKSCNLQGEDCKTLGKIKKIYHGEEKGSYDERYTPVVTKAGVYYYQDKKTIKYYSFQTRKSKTVSKEKYRKAVRKASWIA